MQSTANERMMISSSLNLTKAPALFFLNKSDHVDKINEIRDNQLKFKRLGPVSSNDNAASIESRLQKRWLDLVKADLLPN